MNLYERPGDSELTRFELLVMSLGTLAETLGSSIAKSVWEHEEGRSISSKLGSLFGKGAPSADLQARCFLSVLSIAVHEIIRKSAKMDPHDPHGFQDRFIPEILRTFIGQDFHEVFLHAANKNIDDLQAVGSRDIDETTYIFRMSGRFFEGSDLPGRIAVSAAFPAVVKGVKEALEVLEQN